MVAFHKNGGYSIKTGYWRIKERDQNAEADEPSPESIDQRVWNRVWGAYIPQKIKMCVEAMSQYNPNEGEP